MTNDLNNALADITSIRRQVARAAEFRGYGPATLASTGILAVVAAGAQSRFLPEPATHLRAYLVLWIGTAVLSASLIAAQTYKRSQRMHSGMADEMVRVAVEQFLPSAASGVLITFVLVRAVPSTTWMLPGLWQVILSLGIFASCRFMPRFMSAAGVWYLLTGLFCLSLGDARALSPLAMGLPFGIGQLLVATVLFFSAREAVDEV